MATRQYIGARYVPKFFSGEGGSTEWISGVQYEPLTIVTHLGNSYTSKKPVPVGIDILNTEYWANTGNFNEQVSEYQQEVDEYKQEVDEYKLITNSLNEQVSECKQEVDEYKLITNSLKEDFDTCIDFKYKKVLIIGDSIGDTNIQYLQPNYVTNLKTKLEKLDAIVTNNSVSGRAIGSNVTGTTGGIREAIANITDAYDIIIVELGVNDWAFDATGQQVSDGFSAFNNWIISNEPNAKVYFITPLSTPFNSNKTPLDFYRTMIINNCIVRRYNIIDMFTISNPYSGVIPSLVTRWTYNGDGVHPNSDFAVYYADIVFNALVYNNCGVDLNTISDYTISDIPLLTSAYYRGDGSIRLIGTSQTYTPSASLELLGILPVFCKPFGTITQPLYCSANGNAYIAHLVILPDGRVFGVFPTVTTFSDFNVDITYDSVNHTYVNS